MKRFFSALVVALIATVGVLIRAPAAHAEWTPMITADMFTGIQADVLTCATGILSVVLIVLGIGVLIRVLSR